VFAKPRVSRITDFVTQGGTSQHPIRTLLAHWNMLHKKNMHIPAWSCDADTHVSTPAYVPLAHVPDTHVSASKQHTRTPVLSASSVKVSMLQQHYAHTPLKSNMEAHVSRYSQSCTRIFGVQTQSIFQSADFLAQFIARSLEQKKTVRAIWTRLLQEDKRSLHGLRIVCAGRIGGVEMAKAESRKWGQTPLHSFSQKVDYAGYAAHTTFGKIGVKVWVCYKIYDSILHVCHASPLVYGRPYVHVIYLIGSVATVESKNRYVATKAHKISKIYERTMWRKT